MAKIEIERVAERGAGLSGGREIAKKQKNFRGAEQGDKAQMRGGKWPPSAPPQLRPCIHYSTKAEVPNFIRLHHSTEHSGINQTTEIIQAKYRWKGMHNDIRNYVS